MPSVDMQAAKIWYRAGRIGLAYELGGRKAVGNFFIKRVTREVNFGRFAWEFLGNAKRFAVAQFKGTKYVSSSQQALDAIKSLEDLKSLKSIDTAADISKYSRARRAALGIVGAADLVGDLLIESDLDRRGYGLVTLIPGAGLVELGCAVINKFFGTKLLNAQLSGGASKIKKGLQKIGDKIKSWFK